MSHSDTIGLQSLRPQAISSEAAAASDHEQVGEGRLPPYNSRDSTSRDREHGANRKRVQVLVGAIISQLPIWGFAMTYGLFQEYYTNNWTLGGSQEVTGIIGTTANGVMYLLMPFLFGLFTQRWIQYRLSASILGALISSLGFLLSSFSTHVWHLVVMQGILAPMGCALVYSTTTLSLGEWFRTQRRALALGICLSAKNIVGSVCPFLFRYLLDQYGFRVTLRIWTAISACTIILAICLIPTEPSTLAVALSSHQARKTPWSFLKHRTIWIYVIAIISQSSGYGIPQTYLNTYAHDVTMLSEATSTLLLTLFNVPGVIASTSFGYLADNKHFSMSASTIAGMSALGSALAVFFLWGLTSQGSLALLILFSGIFGFFAGGYSAIWGGFLIDMEAEAIQRNEAIDSGMVYGVLNGARGLGYVVGGLASVPLLHAGTSTSFSGFGYSTTYGALIVFTGMTTLAGGWSVLWRSRWCSCF